MMAIKTVSAVDRPALVLLGGTSDSLAFASLHVLRPCKLGASEALLARPQFFPIVNVCGCGSADVERIFAVLDEIIGGINHGILP